MSFDSVFRQFVEGLPVSLSQSLVGRKVGFDRPTPQGRQQNTADGRVFQRGSPILASLGSSRSVGVGRNWSSLSRRFYYGSLFTPLKFLFAFPTRKTLWDYTFLSISLSPNSLLFPGTTPTRVSERRDPSVSRSLWETTNQRLRPSWFGKTPF